MERSVSEVLEKLYEVLPEEIGDKLRNKVNYWAPEIVWLEISKFVNSKVTKSSTSEVSVKTYAILCNTTEENMRAQFIKDGF